MSFTQTSLLLTDYKIREFWDSNPSLLWEVFQDCFTLPCPFHQFLNAVEKGRTYVVETPKGEIISFIITLIDQKEPWIWSIGTSSIYRGSGLASALLDRTEAYYKDTCYDRINLYVESDNPAQKMYFDKGYRVQKVVRDVFPSHDALKMVKALK